MTVVSEDTFNRLLADLHQAGFLKGWMETLDAGDRYPTGTLFESPIEFLLGASICLLVRLYLPECVPFIRYAENTLNDCKEYLDDRPEIDGAIFPRVIIGEYRVDFLILYTSGGIVVECDGHDFHERTKQQAARDRSKDRTLQSMGFRVLRFTGSEIWNAPLKCAKDVVRMLVQILYPETKAHLEETKPNGAV